MRKLSGGDIDARLARIDVAKTRGKGWKKRAKAKLLASQGAIRHNKVGGKLAGYEFERGHVCAKVRYTKREAYYQLQAADASIDPMRRECRAYHCHFCKGYHLTSKEFDHGYQIQQVESEGRSDAVQTYGRKGNVAAHARNPPGGRTGAGPGGQRERIPDQGQG